jgi:hypothetical protein
MEHRIQLSTALLIAIRTEKKKTVTNQPSVAGIKVFPKPTAEFEKSTHSVDILGNIVSANRKEAFAV